MRISGGSRNDSEFDGLLATYANCKKIRDSDNRWVQFESYIRDHSNAEFTHFICPSCVSLHWGR